MATKLYKYVSKKPVVHPTLLPGFDNKVIWHNLDDELFVTFGDAIHAVFVSANDAGAFKVATAKDASRVKSFLSGKYKFKKREKIKMEFSLEEELAAIRKKDNTVPDRIAAIIAEVDAERDELVNIS